MGANPFKMSPKFNDKSGANANRAAQLGLFEILTSPTLGAHTERVLISVAVVIRGRYAQQ